MSALPFDAINKCDKKIMDECENEETYRAEIDETYRAEMDELYEPVEAYTGYYISNLKISI